MSAEMSDGSFVVTGGCENGHVTLEVRDANGVVRFVSTMSIEEAKVLMGDLFFVVDSIVEAREVSRARRAGDH